MSRSGKQKKRKKAYRCSKFNAGCLLFCRHNLTLNFCLCRSTMTLHQGQGNRNEHGYIWHAYVYRHAKFGCHSLNIVRDTSYGYYNTSLTFVRFEMELWPSMKSKVIGLRNDYNRMLSRAIFTANLIGIAWTIFEVIKHVLFSWLSYVWPWMRVKNAHEPTNVSAGFFLFFIFLYIFYYPCREIRAALPG